MIRAEDWHELIRDAFREVRVLGPVRGGRALPERLDRRERLPERRGEALRAVLVGRRGAAALRRARPRKETIPKLGSLSLSCFSSVRSGKFSQI